MDGVARRHEAAAVVLAILVAGSLAGCTSSDSSEACAPPTADSTLHTCDDVGGGPDSSP